MKHVIFYFLLQKENMEISLPQQQLQSMITALCNGGEYVNLNNDRKTKEYI